MTDLQQLIAEQMAADALLAEQADSDEEGSGGAVEDVGAVAPNVPPPPNEFAVPPLDDAAGLEAGVAPLGKQEEHVASFFDNVRASTKWGVRVYSKIVHLIGRFYVAVASSLSGSCIPQHICFRIESDATPAGHRLQKAWGLSVDRSAKAMLIAASVSWLLPSDDADDDRELGATYKAVGEWVHFDMPSEVRLLSSDKADKDSETEMVFDTLASVKGLEATCRASAGPLELLVALDSASSNISALHLFMSWAESLSRNVVTRPVLCSLHAMNKTISDAAKLACELLGYNLKTLEKRLFLTSRLYGNQANAINEAVEQVAADLDRLKPADVAALDGDEVAVFQQFLSMFELLGNKKCGNIFPADGCVHVFDPSLGYGGEDLVLDQKKLLEGGTTAVHAVFHKPTNPSLTRFATASRAAAEQVLMFIFQSRVKNSICWENWKRTWASPHIGGGDRFTFEDNERECRLVCLVVALISYAGNKLQKRVMKKGAVASWSDMRAKFLKDLETAQEFARTPALWRLLGAGEEAAAPFVSAVEQGLAAQLATTDDGVFFRFAYDLMMQELCTTPLAQWRSVVGEHSRRVGPIIRYNDPTEKTVVQLAKQLDGLSDFAATALLRGFLESWLVQNRSTLKVEQLHARYQAHLRGLCWRSVSEASAHLVRVSLRAARRAADAAQWVASVIPKPLKKRGIDMFVSLAIKEHGLSAWKMWRTDLTPVDRIFYEQAAEDRFARDMNDFRDAAAALAASETANEMQRINGGIRAEFYDALETFVRESWQAVSVEAACESRAKYCERRVPTISPGSCQAQGDTSVGLRRYIGRIVKGLAPGKDGGLGEMDIEGGLDGLGCDDGNYDVEHEAPPGPESDLKAVARVLLAEFVDGDVPEAAGAAGGLSRGVLVLAVALNPLNFWGVELQKGAAGGWELPERFADMKTVAGRSLQHIATAHVFLASVTGRAVNRVGGALHLHAKPSKQKAEREQAGKTITIGHGEAGLKKIQHTKEYLDCVLEDDPEKIWEKLQALRALRDEEEPETKKRKIEGDKDAAPPRPHLEIVREVVASGGACEQPPNRVKVKDRVAVCVLTDEEKKDLEKQRQAERMRAAVPSYRIKSGDSKYTDTMIAVGAKKKDSKKRVVEPCSKVDVRKFLPVKWLFSVLGKKSIEYSITTVAPVEQVRAVLNLWAARHGFIMSCLRGEDAATLHDRAEQPDQGQVVDTQWQVVLGAWQQANNLQISDKTLTKKVEELSTIPPEVLNRLTPLAEGEEDLAAPEMLEDEGLAAAPAAAPAQPRPKGKKKKLVVDEEDDLLA
eukprot:g17724.t1